MAQVVVNYKTPKDTAAFDKYYADTHIPLAKKMPGLRKYQVSKGPVATPAGPSGIHLIATLTFDSMAAVQKAFGSAEGARNAWRAAACGCTCGSAAAAVTSAVATILPTNTPQNISTPPNTRSSRVTIRRKAGAGAMSMKPCSICRIERPRITVRFRVTIEASSRYNGNTGCNRKANSSRSTASSCII